MESSPEYYFDLKGFKFRHIFKDPVWKTLKEIKAALETVDATIFPEIQDSVSTNGKVHIGKGTEVGEFVVIHGPAYIGENCDIRPGAFIRGNVIVGDGCVVGHSTELKNSILLNGAKAPHFNYVGDSILGNSVNLGAGVKLANVRNDRGEIRDGMAKLGAIIGDGSQIGCNTVTNPGTMIGKKVMVHPNATLKGFVKSDSTVRIRTKTETIPRSSRRTR